MKKIMFVIGVLSNGGAERVISILAKGFCDLGYEVSIVTIYGDRNDYVLDDRINIYPLETKSKSKIFKVTETIINLRKTIKSINPDLVISFVAIINLYTIISNLFLNNKIIVSERNDPFQNPESKFLRFFRDYLYKIVDGIVFQTNDALNYFSSSIQQKGIVISNPLKPNLPYWNSEIESKTIITACRLSKQKNLPMLIEAFSEVNEEFPDHKLKIFGVGELKSDLEVIIKKMNLEDNVLLPGFTNDIHYEMANSDLFVISSNYEGISNSMLEALAIGVPVISTDSPVGGARMFIEDNVNGLLTTVGDARELTNAMKFILNNKESAIQLSIKSREIRKELSEVKISNLWIDYVKDVYGGNNAKS